MQTMFMPRRFKLSSLPLTLIDPTAAPHRPLAGGSLHPIEVISIFKAKRNEINLYYHSFKKHLDHYQNHHHHNHDHHRHHHIHWKYDYPHHATLIWNWGWPGLVAGAGNLLPLHVHLTSKYLNVPEHGSPKTLVEARTLHDLLPSQAFFPCFTDLIRYNMKFPKLSNH